MAKKSAKPTEATDEAIDIKSSGIKRRIKKLFGKKGKAILIVIAVIAVILLAYGYVHTRNELKRLSDPQNNAQNETQKVVDKVGKLIVLPNDETPTAATVNDVGKLKSQEFFSRAQDGDKVLVYAKSGRAVLYRPSTNKVVEYSKVNLNTN